MLINGCELANNGEFTQQAFLNKKINFLQAEAINNLIHAENEKAMSFAIDCLVNSDYKKIEEIRNKLFDIIGSIEVNIDYPEYDDVPKYTNEEIFKKIKLLKGRLETIVNDSEYIMPVFNYLNIAIVGEPNVGKSSLLNLLSKQDKAIVSNVKGTTRDVIEAKVNLDGITINFLDTAGIHNTDDEIEKMGINKSIEAINKADLVILMYDKLDFNLEQIENDLYFKKVIKVFNKKDINKYPKNATKISVLDGDIKELLDVLKVEISNLKNFKYTDFILQSDRQIISMKKIISILNYCLIELRNNTPLDLLQSEFEKCIIILNNILGINFEYDKLDELFSKFCLGK